MELERQESKALGLPMSLEDAFARIEVERWCEIAKGGAAPTSTAEKLLVEQLSPSLVLEALALAQQAKTAV